MGKDSEGGDHTWFRGNFHVLEYALTDRQNRGFLSKGSWYNIRDSNCIHSENFIATTSVHTNMSVCTECLLGEGTNNVVLAAHSV